MSKESANSAVTTEIDTDSRTVDNNGNLTVGDSMGDPQATYAKDHWLSIEKIDDTEDDDEDDED